MRKSQAQEALIATGQYQTSVIVNHVKGLVWKAQHGETGGLFRVEFTVGPDKSVHVVRCFSQPEAKSSKKDVPVTADGIYTLGTVKVGRWNYPARTSTEAFVGDSNLYRVTYRNTKRDGSGTWEQFTKVLAN